MIQSDNIVNARISSTMLGIEDHGIMTFMISLDYGGMAQGYGGYAMDSYNPTTKKRIGSSFGIEAIRFILETVGVDRWENLLGKYVRVERGDNYGKIIAIGNIIEDKWCNMEYIISLSNQKS